MKMLELDNVSVHIGDKQLLRAISFTIKGGSMTALLGHNGAGKSTLMKTIMHLTEKQSGKIEVLEKYDQSKQLLHFKKQIAYLPEEPMLMSELTVLQHFQLYGRSYDIPETKLEEKVKKLTEKFDISQRMSTYPEELSKGMRQKVQTICALLPEVPVLLIDEPFMGLDIYAIDFLKQLLKEKLSAGTCILITTHQLETAKEMADQFVLLGQGEIITSGPIEQFDSITRGTSYD